MGEMDNFNLEAPKRCPRCGKEIMFTPAPSRKPVCPGCGELYYDVHLGVWRIRYCEKS